MDTTDLSEMQKLANRLVLEAGKMAFSMQSNYTIVTQKDEVDIATNADVACEKFIISEIRKIFPSHNIYGEEGGDNKQESDYSWVIDPIDGTKEFARGSKDFCCLIAVEKDGQLVVGASYRNSWNSVVTDSLHNGAFLDDKRLAVSRTNELKKALVGMDFGSHKGLCDEEMAQHQLQIAKKILLNCYRIRPGWDDGLLLTNVAAGFQDAHIIMPNRVGWYDVAPGLLFVTEAGGTVTDFHGNNLA